MPDYVRVSSVLSQFAGLHKIPSHILKNAAERGQRVHSIIDAIIEGIGIGPINPDEEGYIESFNNWSVDKKFINKPDRFYCDKYMITGEVDQIYKDKEGYVLVDFKTPLKESKTWPLQASAYAYLCAEKGINISRIEFIQLPKNGADAKVYIYKENFEMFLKCLDIFRYFDQPVDENDYMQYI